MSGTILPGFLGSDESTDRVPEQGYNPLASEFAAIAATNVRTPNQSNGSPQVDQGGRPIRIGSVESSQYGRKALLWSSEGFVLNGATIAALTTAQKIATGTHDTNIGGTAPLDFSPFRNLSLVVNFTSFTAGTSPTIAFELDMQDDTATTPNSLTLWKPTALTAAASFFLSLGPGVAFPQAAAAPSAVPTGFSGIVVPTGWTYEAIGLTFLPQGSFKWTVTGAPTGAVWQAMLYGSN